VIQLAQLFLSLSILIFVHELGHFIAARAFKTRLEKFYLFFDFLFPFGNLLNFSLFKFKKGDTEYGLGWFPLGGYVKIAGMIDESLDTENLNKPAEPWEYRSKPAWQKLIIMLGGIIVNVVVGYIIFSFILFVYGKKTIDNERLVHGIACDSVGYNLGLKDGDKIKAIDGQPIFAYNDIVKKIVLDKAKQIEVVRDGKVVIIPVFEDMISKIIRYKDIFISPRVLSIVDSVITRSSASAIGLKKGDRLLSINGQSIFYYDQVRQVLKDLKKANTSLTFLRGKDTLTKKVAISESGTLGFYPMIKGQIPYVTEKFSIGEAFTKSLSESYQMIAMQVKQLGLIFTVKDAYKGVGGFYSMTKVFASEWDWESFWRLTAMISFGLAFMNLLPIPGLDGGHAIFLIFEMITGKQPSDKFLIAAQYVGMFLILGLMIYANTDWLREWLAKK
jgi:regulator of sigma E protease